MSYRATHEIVVAEQSDGTYTASEPGVDTTGSGDSPPEAIADYASQFIGEQQVPADD